MTATSVDRGENFIPFFTPFFGLGLVPPFSDFFLVILEEYDLLLAHLSPQAVATMPAFQNLCEAFVGVMPSIPCYDTSSFPASAKPQCVPGAYRGHSDQMPLLIFEGHLH